LGSDMLVSRLSVTGKKVCLFLTHVLMLFICWLLFKGSLDQVMVNLESSSAAMEVPMSIFYASGMVCAASSAVILVAHLLRLLRGELSEEELIGIRESEDEPLDLSKQH
jgi:TRAP-type transport system small permease protein